MDKGVPFRVAEQPLLRWGPSYLGYTSGPATNAS